MTIADALAREEQDPTTRLAFGPTDAEVRRLTRLAARGRYVDLTPTVAPTTSRRIVIRAGAR